MNSKRIESLLCAAVLVVGLLCSSANAQGGLPPGVTQDSLTNDIINQVNDGGGAATTNTGTVGTTGNATTGATGDVNTDPEITFDETMIDIEPDARNERGFVGISIASPDPILADFRFVGPQGDSVTAGSTTVNNPRPAGGLGGTTENGFNVFRTTPIRTRIVRSFRAPTVSPSFVSTRVNRRLAQLPATRQFSRSMNVIMQGRTAIIAGTAESQTQIDRLRRQLRLEPGVSKIETQVRLLPR